MNKKIKSQLRSAFNAPVPVRKKEFLQTINFPKANRLDFVLNQIVYIRKMVWVLSCLLALAVMLVLHFYAEDNVLQAVGIISSILPFISLMIITELARSSSYNMAEFEMSCKYSFSDIVLVRLGVLGSLNFVLGALLVVSLVGKTDFNIPRLVIYLFTPFLLTCWLSFFTLNRFKPKEAIYICGGISCFVSVACIISAKLYNMFLYNNYLQLCSITFLILFLCLMKETVKLIKKTEEMQWSL